MKSSSQRQSAVRATPPSPSPIYLNGQPMSKRLSEKLTTDDIAELGRLLNVTVRAEMIPNERRIVKKPQA